MLALCCNDILNDFALHPHLEFFEVLLEPSQFEALS
jgi:hypothetical protein